MMILVVCFQFCYILIMIDSQITDMLGDYPDEGYHLSELTPLEVTLSRFFPSEEPRPHERLLFARQSSENCFDEKYGQGSPRESCRLTQAVLRPKRVSNTIFKTSLSQYRKSLIDEIKARPSLAWLCEPLKNAYGAKNLSVFPKLNFMVRQLQLSSQISDKWADRSMQLLTKKAELMQKGLYKNDRFTKLGETIRIMNQCLEEKSFEKAFELYWGNYRQQIKHQKCKDQVRNFCQMFREMVLKHRQQQDDIEIQDNKPQNSRKTAKRTRKGKATKDSSRQV